MGPQPSLGLAPAPPPQPAAGGLPPPFSLIEPLPGGLTTYRSLEALAARCAELLAGRELSLVLTTGAYPPFAGAPLISVRVAGAPHVYLASAAIMGSDPRRDLDRLAKAIAEANHSRRN